MTDHVKKLRELCRQMYRETIAQARASFARVAPEEQRQIAEYIVKRAIEFAHRKIHLSVMYDCGGPELPAFPYHWKYKNAVGVSFDRKDVAAAQAWTLTALVAGYHVAVQRDTRGGGYFIPARRGNEYRN